MGLLWFLLGGVAGAGTTYVLQRKGVISESYEGSIATSNTREARAAIEQAVFAAFGPPGARRRYEFDFAPGTGWIVARTLDDWHDPHRRHYEKIWRVVDAGGDAIRFDEVPAKEAGEGRGRKRGSLVSTSQTTTAERLVRQAYSAKFGSRPREVFYEHGQWWARSQELRDDGWPYTYSVVDAVPGVGGTGLDFEEV